MLSNVLDLWETVSAEDRERALGIYPMYRDMLLNWAKFYGFGIVPTVEAFAALSPNNDYHGNLRSLSAVMFAEASNTPLDQVTVSTYRACALRAASYLNGSVSFLDTVRGLKITCFRHNLLYPRSSRRVTVDGHMIAVYLGKKNMTMKDAQFHLKSAKHYQEMESVYRRAADKTGMPPPAFQAALWLARKTQNEIKISTQADLFLGGETAWEGVLRPEDYPPYQRGPWHAWAARTGRLSRSSSQ